MESLEAFVLIGGRSSRMGHDKALLTIDGETFVQRAVNTIHSAFPDIKISMVARDENQFHADDLPKGITIVYDIHKDRGAYSGLHAALSNAKSEWIFVLACDMPFVTADLLKFMSDLIDGTFDTIVNMTSDGRVQPLCAFYRKERCLSEIENLFTSNSEKLPSLDQFLSSINTYQIPLTHLAHLSQSERFFENINDPDSFDRI